MKLNIKKTLKKRLMGKCYSCTRECPWRIEPEGARK